MTNLHFDLKNLPPVFGRNEVQRLFPGVISPKSLANLANKGKGPKFLKNGRLAVYMTADFVDWLKDRAKPVSTSDQKWESES